MIESYCVIYPVPKELGQYEVQYRHNERGEPELVIPLERPLSLGLLRLLAGCRAPAALLEYALGPGEHTRELSAEEMRGPQSP